MKTIESQLKRIKQYLIPFITIVKYPHRLNGVCKYVIKGVDNKTESLEFYNKHFNFDDNKPLYSKWLKNTLQLLIRSPEFLEPTNGDSFTFGAQGSPGAKSYCVIDLNGVKYNIYGYERIVLIESGKNGGSLTYIQSVNNDDVVIYQQGITVRVWFARANDVLGKTELWNFLGKALPKELKDPLQSRLARNI